MNFKIFKKGVVLGVTVLAICALSVPSAFAQVPGGTLDPRTVPKYVTPLVIPPVMKSTAADDYDIAVRQFQQQILPGGIWTGGGGLPATTVWSYGPSADPAPDSSGVLGGAAGVAPAPLGGAVESQFNYPAFTIEVKNGGLSGGAILPNTVTVDWINDLKDPLTGNFLPYLIPGVIDQTLHWANPVADCMTTPARTDCRGTNPAPYVGPNPIITHVHGAHVGPESDGYPEAWYLPDPTGSNFLCGTPAQAGTVGPGGKTYYVCEGTLANGYGGTGNTANGTASFIYPNDQPSTTLWYHDHTLGMTRNNVYAGPAGFWLIRTPTGGEDGLGAGMVLPGPAPTAGDDPNFDVTNRATIREIPIVIQDRSFNADGSLFYPANRAFFEGLSNGQTAGVAGNIAAGLNIPFIPGDTRGPSDISPIWNPEFFANTMVVNGTTWPVLEVAPAIYRFRLLNGCNSRFLNLALFEVLRERVRVNRNGIIKQTGTRYGLELTFYQIGAEQSLLPAVVRITTGFKNGLPASDPQEALLMGLAERADVLVDFRGLADGTRIRMINTAPDAPFGGFPDVPADPGTTGQVMEFVVRNALMNGGTNVPGTTTDPFLSNGQVNSTPATAPNTLNITLPDANDPAAAPGPGGVAETRYLALIEEESVDVCVRVSPSGNITYIDLPAGTEPFDALDPANACIAAGGVPFAPKAAVLGYQANLGPPTSTTAANTGAKVTLWSDPIVTNPGVGDTETWELWNFTVDGHPIHLHLVKFKVVEREILDPITGLPLANPITNPFLATEAGWKDTVIAYPSQITRLKATFDIAGLYVWHCHIVEHEDNEMMVPYCVGDKATAPGCFGL